MSQFDQDIVNDFLTESGELLEQLDQDLVLLEQTPRDPDLLNRVFRALHTIKGSASFLALTNLVKIAHAAESALNAARSGSVVLNKSAMDLILAAVDVLKRQFDNLRAGQDLVAPDDRLVVELTGIGEGRLPAGNAQASAPAPSIEIAAETPIVTSATAPADGVERMPLQLDESKASLIEYLVTDVRESLAAAQAALDQLNNPGDRPAACAKLAEFGEAMVKNAQFFDFEQMNKLADAIVKISGEPDMNDQMLQQIMPRTKAVFELLREQTDGLAAATLVKRPIDGLCESIIKVLSDGMPDAARVLPAGASVTDALAIDGVQTAGLTGPAADAAPIARPASTENTATGTAPAVMIEPRNETPSTPTTPTATAGTPETQPAKSESGESRASGGAAGGEQTIRVEVGRLESLLNLVGELVLQKNRLSAIARNASAQGIGTHEFHETFSTATGNLDRVTSDIQVAVMRTRMQPLDKLFGKYPRLIRDLARKTGKEMRLVIEGGDTEVDKSVIEELGDPLVHILRNSADHGLETPDQRKASGKPETGTITLSASHQGSFVQIVISDDGRGLSRRKIGAKAVERGLITEQALAQMSDKDVYRMIFAAGFSTAEKVTDLSGRGVGMDVVRTNIEKIKGAIELDTIEGQRTSITIKIPLTVAILTAMMVRIGSETYAVPLSSIVEIVKPDPSSGQLSSIQGVPVMRLRDAVLPLLDGCEIFQLPSEKRAETPFAVIIALGDKRIGLLVTRLIGQQEVVIKPLDEMVDRAGPVSGATVRDDGGVSLIVDVARMVRIAEERAANRGLGAIDRLPTETEEQTRANPRPAARAPELAGT